MTFDQIVEAAEFLRVAAHELSNKREVELRQRQLHLNAVDSLQKAEANYQKAKERVLACIGTGQEPAAP